MCIKQRYVNDGITFGGFFYIEWTNKTETQGEIKTDKKSICTGDIQKTPGGSWNNYGGKKH